MKIYTKTGDGGETGMVGGGRVGKDSLRIAAFGEVDELNAVLGLCLATVRSSGRSGLRGEAGAKLEKILHHLQQEIFDLGADLATPLDSKVKVPRVSAEQILQLEKWIDEIELQLKSLQNFILPGGTVAAAQLHLARTVCRRAERAIVTLAAKEKISKEAVKYVNRLSDLLFVIARWANRLKGENEELWKVR